MGYVSELDEFEKSVEKDLMEAIEANFEDANVADIEVSFSYRKYRTIIDSLSKPRHSNLYKIYINTIDIKLLCQGFMIPDKKQSFQKIVNLH